jgi:hypothetical protein
VLCTAVRSRCQSPGAAHCPILLPSTLFGKPPESPTCTAGLLPWRIRLPWIVLVTTPFESGSAATIRHDDVAVHDVAEEAELGPVSADR